MGTEKTPPPVRADTLNSGKCDVFSKINSRLGNFDRCQKKREEGGRRGQARPPPRAPAFLTFAHFFLPPPFLPTSLFFLFLPSTILSILTCATHNYSTAIATAPRLPPTATVTTSTPRQANHYASWTAFFIAAVHRAFNLSSHFFFFDSTSARLPHRSGHPYRHTNASAILEHGSSAQYVLLPVIFCRSTIRRVSTRKLINPFLRR